MPLIERLTTSIHTFAQATDTARSVVINFPLRVPRGAIGRIIRGELLIGFASDADPAVPAGMAGALMKGFERPIAGAGLSQVVGGVVMMVGMVALETGTATNLLALNALSRAKRDFRNEPHRVAEIRNAGKQQGRDLGWSVVISVASAAPSAFVLSTLEIEIEYIEDAKPTANFSRQRKVWMMNQ